MEKNIQFIIFLSIITIIYSLPPPEIAGEPVKVPQVPEQEPIIPAPNPTKKPEPEPELKTTKKVTNTNIDEQENNLLNLANCTKINTSDKLFNLTCSNFVKLVKLFKKSSKLSSINVSGEAVQNEIQKRKFGEVFCNKLSDNLPDLPESFGAFKKNLKNILFCNKVCVLSSELVGVDLEFKLRPICVMLDLLSSIWRGQNEINKKNADNPSSGLKSNKPKLENGEKTLENFQQKKASGNSGNNIQPNKGKMDNGELQVPDITPNEIKPEIKLTKTTESQTSSIPSEKLNPNTNLENNPVFDNAKNKEPQIDDDNSNIEVDEDTDPDSISENIQNNNFDQQKKFQENIKTDDFINNNNDELLNTFNNYKNVNSNKIDPFYEENGSNFFTYFLMAMFGCIIVYVLYHNKSKIIALLLEGKNQRHNGRRKHSAAYRKLDCNLEEAISSQSNATRSSQIIY